MMDKYGFIGGGNMGGALAASAIAAVGAEHVLLVDRDEPMTKQLASRIGAQPSNYEEIAATCRLIFIGVKPNLVAPVLERLRPMLAARTDSFAVVSIAAGVTLDAMYGILSEGIPVIRMMQNTPVAVGDGMLVYAASASVSEDDITALKQSMACAGRLDALDEAKIDAATAVMGCGPAFVYSFIEALADGGVACGLTRAQAQLYAAQTLLGASQMVLQSDKHPGELKDAVCSPGGSTIAGVHALEQAGFRGAVMDAVLAAYNKTQALGK